ncbi:MAG: hypothetical protein ACI9VS_003479 [Candidatus Binatia bacterium]|jgi:hypothetical protein
MKRFSATLALAILTTASGPQAWSQQNASEAAMDIGQRRELFVGRQLIGKMENVDFRLHEPAPQPRSKNPLPIIYGTVIKDGDLYRGYYRAVRNGHPGKQFDGHPGEITCYAESRDGNEWTYPQLGIFDIEGPQGKNAIWDGKHMCSHNFSPFLDQNPDTPREHRFKALAGVHAGGGLFAFSSADGIHWKLIQETPVVTSKGFAFDSQNVSFWSVAEQCYVCYFRSWDTPHGRLRTISRTTSKDLIHWSKPVSTNPNVPKEHLYTSLTQPYFRAPHIYIATPTRFRPDRGSSTDILFMSSRAGSTTYDRLFTEVFIRPGLAADRWGNRSNYAALNVTPTSPEEMSIYHKDGRRYTLRTDGFISVRAGAEQGTLLTKPVTFSGSQLTINFSTSAAGALRVELQDRHGKAMPGFALADCKTLVGDKIDQTVEWKGNPDLAKLAKTPVRLRFEMIECDLYSFRFQSSK